MPGLQGIGEGEAMNELTAFRFSSRHHIPHGNGSAEEIRVLIITAYCSGCKRRVTAGEPSFPSMIGVTSKYQHRRGGALCAVGVVLTKLVRRARKRELTY